MKELKATSEYKASLLQKELRQNQILLKKHNQRLIHVSGQEIEASHVYLAEKYFWMAHLVAVMIVGIIAALVLLLI